MKLFKIVDLYISLCLIIGFAIACAFHTDLLFYGFFITGAWQLISILVHLLNGWFRPKESLRTAYSWVVLAILAIGVFMSLAYSIVLFYYLLIPVAPVLMITYSYICYDEIKKLKTRPLGLYK